MADNRQFADHVELGGANVYFKEEPTTGTTMPNTSYFKTEDVDGKPVKISRDNIMGIVKECLGTILNGGSDQTTVTKVPTLNDNTLGASTISTLASLLGATIKISDASAKNLNNYHNNGIYDTTNWSNVPTGSEYSVTEVINYSGLECIQNCYNILDGSCRRRIFVNSNWSAWSQV